MAEIARWHEHVFEVSPETVKSFSELSVKGAAETKEKKSGKEAYVSYKNAQAKQVTMLIQLNAQFGVDVQTEAMAFVDDACAGASDFFYINGKKLMMCMLMLTEATIEKISVSLGGWTRADVRLTFMQCTNDSGKTTSSGSSSSSSSSSKKASVKSTSVTKTSSSSSGSSAAKDVQAAKNTTGSGGSTASNDSKSSGSTGLTTAERASAYKALLSVSSTSKTAKDMSKTKINAR